MSKKGELVEGQANCNSDDEGNTQQCKVGPGGKKGYLTDFSLTIYIPLRKSDVNVYRTVRQKPKGMQGGLTKS